MPESKYRWNAGKDQQLRRERGIGFDDVVEALDGGRVLDEYDHPSELYAGQTIKVVEIRGYAFIVPCIESADGVFLKTAYPSRKATKQYLRR